MFRFLTVCLALASAASAATIISPGSTGTGIETDVVFTTGATGTTLTGTAGASTVQFTSTQNLTVPAPNRVQASSGLLTNISFALPTGYTFGDAMFDAFCQGAHAGCGSSVTITTNDGTTATKSIGNGGNFFTITGTGLSSVSLASAGLSDLRIVKLSDVAGPGIPPTSAVPEPGTVGMLAIGLGAVAFGIARKRQIG